MLTSLRVIDPVDPGPLYVANRSATVSNLQRDHQQHDRVMHGSETSGSFAALAAYAVVDARPVTYWPPLPTTAPRAPVTVTVPPDGAPGKRHRGQSIRYPVRIQTNDDARVLTVQSVRLHGGRSQRGALRKQ